MRLKAKENFTQDCKRKRNEAKSQGGLPFMSYGNVNHFVSGQPLEIISVVNVFDFAI